MADISEYPHHDRNWYGHVSPGQLEILIFYANFGLFAPDFQHNSNIVYVWPREDQQNYLWTFCLKLGIFIICILHYSITASYSSLLLKCSMSNMKYTLQQSVIYTYYCNHQVLPLYNFYNPILYDYNLTIL